MVCVSPGDVRLDPQPQQQPPSAVAVVSPIRIRFVGQFLGASRLSTHLGKIEKDRQDLRLVAGIGPGGMGTLHGERCFLEDSDVKAGILYIDVSRLERSSENSNRLKADNAGIVPTWIFSNL